MMTVALKITIDKVPKWIEPMSSKAADLRIVLESHFCRYSVCDIAYEFVPSG